MADFQLTGRVVGFGGDAGRTGFPTVDLEYRVSLRNTLLGGLFSTRSVLQTQPDDTFSTEFTIPDETLVLLLFPGSRVSIRVEAFAPPANRRSATVNRSVQVDLQTVTNPIETLANLIEAVTNLIRNAAQDLTVEIDLSLDSVQPLRVEVFIEGEADELENINELTFDLLQFQAASLESPPDVTGIIGGQPGAGVPPPPNVISIGSGVARRSGDSFVGRIFSGRVDLNRDSSWLIMHRGVPRPITAGPITNPGRIFVRTRVKSAEEIALTDSEGLLDSIETGILLTQFREAIRQDDLEDNIRDEIAEDTGVGLLIARNLRLDLQNDDEIQIDGDVGYGVGSVNSPFQLFQIGRFDITLSVGLFGGRRLRPCRGSEFDNPLDIDLEEHSFDILPETDLDELPFGQSVIEDFISGTVADSVMNAVREQIHDRLDERIDEVFEERTDQLTAAASLQGVPTEEFIAEVRDSLYMQIDDVDIEDNDLNVVGFAGIWHPVVALRNIDNAECPAFAAAVMFSDMSPMPMFRRYQKAFRHKRLSPWLRIYREHQRELAQIVRRDPSLAGRVIRLAADLGPVLSEKGKIPLSNDAVERLLEVSEIARKRASPALVEVIDHAKKVFSDGAGKALPELVELATKHCPSPKGQSG